MRKGNSILIRLIIFFVWYYHVGSLELRIPQQTITKNKIDIDQIQNRKEHLKLNMKNTERKEKRDVDTIEDDNRIADAIKGIAYYLRNHKFNEWDRRISETVPDDIVGFYTSFPEPPLNPLHWKVVQYCDTSYEECVRYLHQVMTEETIQQTRNYDMSDTLYPSNNESPFQTPLERFQWRTTASYFMCWYTMKEVPALSMIGEACDNFAEGSKPINERHNQDIRSDDTQPFACALYSFCPDPCCPIKKIQNSTQCDVEGNPCFIVNSRRKPSDRQCKFDRKANQDLYGLINNHWNVTCNCGGPGFNWISQFGMCVDDNECVTGEHSCDMVTEECFNLPGTFQCVCKLGYKYDEDLDKCI